MNPREEITGCVTPVSTVENRQNERYSRPRFYRDYRLGWEFHTHIIVWKWRGKWRHIGLHDSIHDNPDYRRPW